MRAMYGITLFVMRDWVKQMIGEEKMACNRNLSLNRRFLREFAEREWTSDQI